MYAKKENFDLVDKIIALLADAKCSCVEAESILRYTRDQIRDTAPVLNALVERPEGM